MKAVAINHFGGPEVFKEIEAPRPKSAQGQVFIEVHASGLNPVDYKIRDRRAAFLSPPFPCSAASRLRRSRSRNRSRRFEIGTRKRSSRPRLRHRRQTGSPVRLHARRCTHGGAKTSGTFNHGSRGAAACHSDRLVLPHGQGLGWTRKVHLHSGRNWGRRARRPATSKSEGRACFRELRR